MRGGNTMIFSAFFDLNKSYVNYKNNGDWLSIYEAFVRNKISSASIMKKFFIEPERETDEEAEEVVYGFVFHSCHTS